jgi:hypothetical protein
MLRPISIWIGIASIVLVALLAPPALAEWSGQEEMRDGVAHVMNPADPATPPTTETVTELWRAGGDDADDVLFGVISAVAVDDDGRVYLLDSQINVVHVFSPEGEFLGEIGREGEGPGEFRNPEGMFVTADGNVAILQGMPGKIIRITPQGDPLDNIRLPGQDDGGMMMLSGGIRAGDDLVLSTRDFEPGENELSITNKLVRVNSAGALAATYNASTLTRSMAGFNYDERRDAEVLFTATRDGDLFVFDGWDEYAIKAYDDAGNLTRVIERDFEPRKRSKAEMEDNKPRAFIQNDQGTQEIEAIVSKTDRSVRDLYARDDGTLWVVSSRGASDKPEGTMASFDVFDSKGHFVREIALAGDADFTEDGFHFDGDRLIIVKGFRGARRAMFAGLTGGEDEEEEVEPLSVVCYDVSRIVSAGR